MAGAAARLAALENRLRPRGRIVIGGATLSPEGVPGAITATPTGFLPTAPEDFAADPAEGLTAEQWSSA